MRYYSGGFFHLGLARRIEQTNFHQSKLFFDSFNHAHTSRRPTRLKRFQQCRIFCLFSSIFHQTESIRQNVDTTARLEAFIWKFLHSNRGFLCFSFDTAINLFLSVSHPRLHGISPNDSECIQIIDRYRCAP